MSLKKIKQFLGTYLDLTYQGYLSRNHPACFRKNQKRKLSNQLRKVVRNSSYYGKLVNREKSVTYEDFPIINKEVMMEAFDQLNTRGICFKEAKKVALQAEESRDFSPKIGDISVGLSSGTTGNQGVFLVSDQEVAQWASAMLRKAIDRKKFRKMPIVIAFFMRASNNLYTSINKKNIRLHFFDLLMPIPDNITKLEKLQPNVIVAQPSMLREVAKFYEKHKIGYEIKEIFSIAEVLEQIDQEYIEQRLCCSLKEIYQATEGFLGISCCEGTMHLNEDILFIEKEYIDKASGRFVPIITDLYRSTQPLIRYRHTDILVEKKSPCSCGSCFIAVEKIEGREDDCFFAKTRNGWVRIFPDFIRYAIIRSSETILQFHCIQKSEFLVEVTLEIKNSEEEKEVRRAVSNNIKKLFPKTCQKFVVVEVFFSKIDYVQGQKLRRVQSILNREE